MTASVHDYVGQVVTGAQLRALGDTVPATTVVYPVGEPEGRPWWRERGLWMNGAAAAPHLVDSLRYMVLRAPVPEVGDVITSADMLATLPLTTVLIDARGLVAQSWIDVDIDVNSSDGASGSGDEHVRWSVTAWGESQNAVDALGGMIKPVTILHLPPKKD